MGLVEFAGWLATQVFDVVGSFAGVQGADGGATVDLQAGLAAIKNALCMMWCWCLHYASSSAMCFGLAGAVGMPAMQPSQRVYLPSSNSSHAAGWQDCVP